MKWLFTILIASVVIIVIMLSGLVTAESGLSNELTLYPFYNLAAKYVTTGQLWTVQVSPSASFMQSFTINSTFENYTFNGVGIDGSKTDNLTNVSVYLYSVDNIQCDNATLLQNKTFIDYNFSSFSGDYLDNYSNFDFFNMTNFNLSQGIYCFKITNSQDPFSSYISFKLSGLLSTDNYADGFMAYYNNAPANSYADLIFDIYTLEGATPPVLPPITMIISNITHSSTHRASANASFDIYFKNVSNQNITTIIYFNNSNGLLSLYNGTSNSSYANSQFIVNQTFYYGNFIFNFLLDNGSSENFTSSYNFTAYDYLLDNKINQLSPVDSINSIGLYNISYNESIMLSFDNKFSLNDSLLFNVSLPDNVINSSVYLTDSSNNILSSYINSSNVFFNASFTSDNMDSYDSQIIYLYYDLSVLNVTGINTSCIYSGDGRSGTCTGYFNISNIHNYNLNDIPFTFSNEDLINFESGLSNIFVYWNLVNGNGSGSYQNNYFNSSIIDSGGIDQFCAINPWFYDNITEGYLYSSVACTTGGTIYTFNNDSINITTEVLNSSNNSITNYSLGSISTTRDLGSLSSYSLVVVYSFNLGTGGSSYTGGSGGTIYTTNTSDFTTSFSKNSFDVYYVVLPFINKTDRIIEISTNRELKSCKIKESGNVSCFVSGSSLFVVRDRPSSVDSILIGDSFVISVTSIKNEILNINGNIRTVNLESKLGGSIPFWVVLFFIIVIFIYCMYLKYERYLIKKWNVGDLFDKF